MVTSLESSVFSAREELLKDLLDGQTRRFKEFHTVDLLKLIFSFPVLETKGLHCLYSDGVVYTLNGDAVYLAIIISEGKYYGCYATRKEWLDGSLFNAFLNKDALSAIFLEGF